MTWTKLCEELPKLDEPIALKYHGKSYFGIHEQDEDGDFIHCQDESNGDFVFSLSLNFLFNDPNIFWRNFDD